VLEPGIAERRNLSSEHKILDGLFREVGPCAFGGCRTRCCPEDARRSSSAAQEYCGWETEPSTSFAQQHLWFGNGRSNAPITQAVHCRCNTAARKRIWTVCHAISKENRHDWPGFIFKFQQPAWYPPER
jgi:hypothetical protein